MTTTAQLAVTPLNVIEAQCEAVFAAALQPSDAPAAGTVAQAIDRAVQQLGIGGCITRMAQEFGDHPDAAAERMRWARQLIAHAAARPRASLAGKLPGRSPEARDATIVAQHITQLEES